jgi:hypothetical protein
LAIVKYSAGQMERMRKLIYDEWVVFDPIVTKLNFHQLLTSIEAPEELHQYAGNFNWDCGCEEMESVVSHPQCDRGTAFLIYHLAAPAVIYRRVQSGKFLLPGNITTIAFLRTIEEMVREADFSSNRIRFDASKWRFRSRTINFLTREGTDLIPDYMKTPTSGEEVEILIFDQPENPQARTKTN